MIIFAQKYRILLIGSFNPGIDLAGDGVGVGAGGLERRVALPEPLLRRILLVT